MAEEDDQKTSHISELVTEDQQINKLSKFLLKQKIIEGWELIKAIGNGANGVVLEVRKLGVPKNEKPQKAVLKIAISGSASGSLFWECNIMNKLVHKKNNEDRTLNTARILDSGVTLNHEGEKVGYVVMECLPGNPVAMIAGLQGEAMMSKICEFGLQLLKALYDLHYCGFIHRDIKPENVGLYKDQILVLYDMGMVRVLTDEHGNLREPRTWVGVRGTDEWASLAAEQGRDQTVIDDLWGWLYTLVEWVNCKSRMPQAWAAYDSQPSIRMMMKSNIFPAQHVLANCPSQFFKIQAYLRCLSHTDTPDYFYIASLMNEARRNTKRKRAPNMKLDQWKYEQEYLEKQFF